MRAGGGGGGGGAKTRGGGGGGGGAAKTSGLIGVWQLARRVPIARTNAIAHTRARDSGNRIRGSAGVAFRGAPPEKNAKPLICGCSSFAALGSYARFPRYQARRIEQRP